MNKFSNFIKDVFYSITDYGMIMSIIVIVAIVLIWRINILFNMEIIKNPLLADTESLNVAMVENSEKENTPKQEEPTVKDNTPDNNSTINNNSNNNSNNDNVQDVEITVPQGSFPSKIAEILIGKGLITDKNEFLQKSIELELDTKLQSGNFTIKKGETVENIIKIIAKQL